MSRLKEYVVNVRSLAELDLDLVIDEAAIIVEESLLDVKTHQIRRFYNVVKNLKGSLKNSGKRPLTGIEKAKLLMLRPQLANASAKQYRLKNLSELIALMIKKIHDTNDFELFANFFESIVAFHKAKVG